MDYVDEKILELRKLQKKMKYATLDTGMYIKDEIMEFERVALFYGNMSIMLPKTFVTLPTGMAHMKYPAETRPQIIKSSLDTSINFGFSWIPQDMDEEHVEMAANQLHDIIKKLNPANVFAEFNVEEREDTKVAWFDYKSFAIDGQVYNLMLITPIEKKMLHGVFNCSYEDAGEWKPAAHQMLLSIWDLTRYKRREL